MEADRPSAEAPPFITVLLLFGLLAFSGELVSAAKDLWTELGGTLKEAWQWIFGLGLDFLLIGTLWRRRTDVTDAAASSPVPAFHAWVIVAVLFLGLDVARRSLGRGAHHVGPDRVATALPSAAHHHLRVLEGPTSD